MVNQFDNVPDSIGDGEGYEWDVIYGANDVTIPFPASAEPAPAPELTIYFRDLAQAMDIISGRGNPIEAFMQGDFRSSGHIVWVFQTLAAFSKQTELPGLSGD